MLDIIYTINIQKFGPIGPCPLLNKLSTSCKNVTICTTFGMDRVFVKRSKYIQFEENRFGFEYTAFIYPSGFSRFIYYALARVVTNKLCPLNGGIKVNAFNK